jgi:hypothetical protein
MRVRTISRGAAAPTGLALMLACAELSAMMHNVVGNAFILSGEVVYQDLERARKTLDTNKNITHIVLRNSMGGNSWTGYRMGELFRERGLTTVVSGHCVSSCSRLFLGGKTRMFSDDFPASLTYIGFHGHYDFGKLNLEAVKKNDQAAWTKKFTDNKVDPKLVERWINIERRAGDVRFYPSGVVTRWKAQTFLCQGSESSRPNLCEKISTDAMKEGIVTSREIYSSADASNLPYKQREKQYPTTPYAAIEDIAKLPTKSARARKDYALFLNAAVPRAFAISRDARTVAWSAYSARAAEVALETCDKKSANPCRLYAVDERIVFVPENLSVNKPR